jgi:hypothetical protein
MGAIDGGSIGQTLGGHIGGISTALLHNGRFSPLVHLHTQPALAPEETKILIAITVKVARLRIICMVLPPTNSSFDIKI